jgi:hypothetical protein
LPNKTIYSCAQSPTASRVWEWERPLHTNGCATEGVTNTPHFLRERTCSSRELGSPPTPEAGGPGPASTRVRSARAADRAMDVA